MSLKCVLGLVACLNHESQTITAHDAVEIIDTCEQISKYKVSDFKEYKQRGGGRVLADIMYDQGLRFKYPDDPTPYQRRKAVFIACRQFTKAFNTDSKWDNLDKWPWK